MSRKKTGKVLFRGVESGMFVFRIIVLLLFIGFWFSGISTIPSKDVGILTHFGKVVPSSTRANVRQPGLVLALPKPIGALHLSPSSQVQTVEVEDVWKSLETEIKNNKIDPLLEGYCISGDNNVVQTSLRVKYYIRDAEAWTFCLGKKQEDKEHLIRSLVLASLTQTISGWKEDEVLQLQRTYEVPRESVAGTENQAPQEMVAVTEKLDEVVQRRAQKRLDALESGIFISGIEFQQMHCPRHVYKEFVNVRTTRTTAETERHAAEGEASRMKRNAETLVTNRITWAKNYREVLLAEATAEQREFEPLYREYTRAPELVWQRIYMDTVQQVMGTVGTVDFVPPNTRVILPNSEERK